MSERRRVCTCAAEEDRRERRRKLGLPEELSEEEKAAERAKQEERGKAKAAHALPVRRVTLTTQLRGILARSPRGPHAVVLHGTAALKYMST